MWMELLELMHLALGTPMQVAVPSVPNIGLGNRLAPKRIVEPCSKFVCNALVLNETLCARLPNGLLVEAHGIQLSAFNARDLRIDQRRSAPEVLRANRGPLSELFVVRPQPFKQIAPLLGRNPCVDRPKR